MTMPTLTRPSPADQANLPANRRPERVIPALLAARPAAAAALEDETPFLCLCRAMLRAAPAGAAHAARAGAALAREGWTSPARLAGSDEAAREAVLRAAGYARCAGLAARRLGGMARLLMEEHGGDLDALRRQAAEDPAALRRLLKRIPGVGDVAADIFFREIQLLWPELYPFADRLALRAARRLRLGDSAAAIAGLCPRPDFPRLVAALVETEMRDDYLALTRRLSA